MVEVSYPITNTMALTKEVQELFEIARSRVGAPIMEVELTDDQMCNLLKLAIGDYTEQVQNWVIETQWLGAYGKSTNMSSSDLAYALTVRNLDMTKDYSYWFSKEVGLQQRGPWELKKDFIQVERGKQVYVVPAGREINEVMYVTPPTTKAAMYGAYGGFDTGFGGGFGQIGGIYNGTTFGSFFIGGAYDAALLASNLKQNNQFLRGDLCYKVTAGPDGTHLIHLMSVPGSPNAFSGMAIDDKWGWNKYVDCYVWYTYYDVVGLEADECRVQNKSVIITPDQVPMDQMRYEFLNNPAQQVVRQLFIAEVMITLGITRGTFSGKVMIPDAEENMDYNMLLELGKQEKEKVLQNLKERLDRMTPWNLMQKQAEMAKSLGEILEKKPLGMYVL